MLMREVTIVCEECGHRWRTVMYTPEESRERRTEGYPMGNPYCEKCHSVHVRVT